MFKNIYPLFERKRLLKKEMLENLRDYPRDLFRIVYQDYSDGILAGCGLAVRDGSLYIQPGILYHRKVPYLLTEEWEVSCEATGRLTYLKVRFADKVSGAGQEESLSQICLDGAAPDHLHELELARFKLQAGARLRDTYTDFIDYSTEFDTIGRIHARFAAPGRSSIDPQILKRYAEELMRCPVQEPWDCAFCLQCMQIREAMPYEAIRSYLNVRLKQEREDYSNEEIYDLLKQILLEAGGKGQSGRQTERGDRKLLLL